VQATFSLDLSDVSSGWVTGAATLADDRLPLLGSWFEDSPQQLLVAAHDCLHGTEAQVWWVEEPDSKVWTLTPEGGSLRLLVQRCKGLGPTLERGYEPVGDETYLVPRRGFAVAVLAAMDALALTVPVERYESEWRHPWPEVELTRLRRALGNPVRSHRR
jgi:hypothetical protein